MRLELAGLEAAMYLRKSRAEDGMDTAEILRRHREILTEYAARNGIRITETFQEIKSGESLYARPEMGRMLEEVQDGRFRAVLCMDIDRLSRGETRERGIIWAAFKASGTLIVTPAKVYDLSEDSDELMTELRGLFAHYELGQIKERTRRGTERAVKEGCFLAPAPYGYRKRSINRCKTLEIYEPEAAFVRQMFEWYASGVGADVIAKRLNAAGARPRYAEAFTKNAVLHILKNPAYIGKVVYFQTRWVRKERGMGSTPRPKSDWITVDGIHPAIISEELFEQCQNVLKSRWRPQPLDRGIKSPLAGLVRCKKCGGRMHKMWNNGYQYLRCLKGGCSVLANYSEVERAVIEGLREILSELETVPAEQKALEIEETEARLSVVRESIDAEKRKRTRLYDFLESGTYTEAVFRERREAVDSKIAALEEQEQSISAKVDALKGKDAKRQAQGIRSLLSQYESMDGAGKNALLLSIVDVIIYDRPTRYVPFALEIFLK